VLANQTMLMTANEAASVTGVPLRQVHRIIDAGLLGGAVKRRDKARLLAPKALVGLKLAHDTADVLTLRSRRAVVATSIRQPRQAMIRTDLVVIDARPAARARDALAVNLRARTWARLGCRKLKPTASLAPVGPARCERPTDR